MRQSFHKVKLNNWSLVGERTENSKNFEEILTNHSSISILFNNYWSFYHLDNFADYKRLRGGVYFLKSFPMTPSGKVLRRRVKDIVAQLYENKNGEADSESI